MGLGRAGGRAGAGGTLDRAKREPSGLREPFAPRHDVTCRAHVTGFFLNPHHLARLGMLGDSRGNFRARQRVQLIQKENGGIRVIAAATLGAQLMPDFSLAIKMRRASSTSRSGTSGRKRGLVNS